MGQVDPIVVVNQAKANTIQPPGPAQYVPVDHGVAKEVDQRVRRQTENLQVCFVPIGAKHAVRSPKTLTDSAGQIETEGFRDLGSEYAV
jgi:hypothetical protein